MKLTTKLLEKIIKESIDKCLLTESAQDKAAINYLKTKGVTDYNEQMRIIGAIKHDINNLRMGKGKFVQGALRLYYDGQLNNEDAINTLNEIIGYIFKGNHQNEYDFNLNGMSLNDLSQRFQTAITADKKRSREESYAKQHVKNDEYRIVRIPDYETASKYGRYTSWCVTHDEGAYNTYTGNGTGLFYFCLKDGFENVPEVVGENCPLDEYGLSMIAVSVDMEGNPHTCTCRWNHDNGGNDNIMDKDELEELLGVNYYEVFKPYTVEELHAKGIILFSEVPGLLAQGVDPRKIFKWVADFFDGYARVYLNGKYNYVGKDNKLLRPDQWYDFTRSFQNGYAKVKLNGKYNFIDTDGKYLWDKPFDQWFDYVFDFCNGYAIVKLNGKYNYLGENRRLLKPDQWLNSADDFRNGYAMVVLNRKFNFLKPDGTYLWDKPIEEWFDDAGNFHNDYAVVKLNGKYNFIDTNGKYLWDKPIEEWFDYASNFHNDYAVVKSNGNDYYLGTDGQLYDRNTKQPVQLQENNSKRHFYITESQLRKIVKRGLKH